MSKKSIEVLCLIDRSGSMSNIMLETVNAFNTFIDEQKKAKIDDTVYVTLASFDDRYEIVFDHVNINKLSKLTVDMVAPRGMTALNDGIGKLITGTKYPKRPTVLLIQTDGMENASQEYTTANIKDLIENKKKDGWDVNFIGAGLSQVEVQNQAIARGIEASKSMAFSKSASGMAGLHDYYTATTTSFRSTTTTKTSS